MESQGRTVGEAGKLAGLVAISDTLKVGAIEVVARVKEAGEQPAMISGDNWRTADSD